MKVRPEDLKGYDFQAAEVRRQAELAKLRDSVAGKLLGGYVVKAAQDREVAVPLFFAHEGKLMPGTVGYGLGTKGDVELAVTTDAHLVTVAADGAGRLVMQQELDPAAQDPMWVAMMQDLTTEHAPAPAEA